MTTLIGPQDCEVSSTLCKMLSVGLDNDQMDMRDNLNPAVSKRFALQCTFEVLSRKTAKRAIIIQSVSYAVS